MLVTLAFYPSMRGGFTRSGSVTAFDESIATYSGADCSTPKASWNVGQTACAVATGAVERRIVWVAPDGSIAQFSSSSTCPSCDGSGLFSGTANDTYAIPANAQVGTWRVETIDGSGVGFASAQFVVLDPAHASVDLNVANYGPFDISAGNNVNYRVELTNNGPNDAQNVVLTSPVPSDTTFMSETQNSGPEFTCTSPPSGSATGTISCTITTLPANATAVFTFAFNVSNAVADGTTITTTASVSSSTNELNNGNNTASSSATVSGTSTTCTINCPGNVDANNDANQCSAVVTYVTPSPSGNCGVPPENTVICNPPSGSVFSIGTSAVSCSTQSGGSCSFNVTVHDTRPPVQPTITCPGTVTASEEFPGSGSATVTYAAPTATGNCVNTVCAPPSGTRFNAGTTVVNCTATDSANTSTTCSFNVVVTTGGSCTINCPADITRTASQCSGLIVTYTDPTQSGGCGTVTCNPPSGSTFPVGNTTVTCSSSSTGADCDFAITVNAPAPPTITTCATNKAIAVNSLCEATMPNLVSEVVATGCNVTVTQSPAAGSVVAAGIYVVLITAENSAGEATCSATVTVDTQAPVITTCPSPTTASADANCKAPVPNVIGGVVATDNCTAAGQLIVTQSPAAGTLVDKGPTTITITVKDESNNAVTCTTTFTVNDSTPPAITCPANVVVYLPLNSTATSMVVNYTAVTASDNCPGVTVSSTPASGSVFPVGPTTVNATATDAANNTSTCSFTVTVLYNFTGFFSPVGNPPVLNNVNAGRAIPVKFSLSGAKGLSIFASGFPVSGQIDCDATAPPSEVTETITAGGSSLSYDSTTGQYVYVWKTEDAWAGTCRQLALKLNDGSTYVANFKFR